VHAIHPLPKGWGFLAEMRLKNNAIGLLEHGSQISKLAKSDDLITKVEKALGIEATIIKTVLKEFS